LPDLVGKIAAVAVRAPVPDGALVDITAQLKTDVTRDEVNNCFKAAQSLNQQIIEYSEEGLVSADIIGNAHSAIIDGLSTDVLQKKMVKVMAWYDNEAAYAKRMLDLASYIVTKVG
jgi:glyceraldehyde-3-phosphate dehydrogenase/erythrose-4-phosphate dehydrogenase